MDPDQALKDAREFCAQWHEGERSDHDLVVLVNAFEALDTWLSRGGDWKVLQRKGDHEPS